MNYQCVGIHMIIQLLDGFMSELWRECQSQEDAISCHDARCTTYLAVLNGRHPLDKQLGCAAVVGAAQQPVPVPVPVEPERCAPRALALPDTTLTHCTHLSLASRQLLHSGIMHKL